MKSSNLTKLFLALALALVFGFSLGDGQVLAQSAEVAIDGLDTVGTTAGLGSEDPTIIVAKIIRGALGVLGLIGMVILMYGGFVWMTAGGSEDKVTRAKRLIINAGVGVAIILASFGITEFVLQALINATNENGGGSSSFDDGGGIGLGGGTSSVFSITMQLPTGQLAIRNVVPQITFSKNLDAATVTNENIKFIYADSGLDIPGTLTTSGNRVSFVPATPCPEPDADRFCFNENAVVNVTVDTAVKSSTGTVLTCTNDLCNSTFTTGVLIDTEAPVARLELPDDGAGVASDSLIDVQVSASDDAQVAVADFAVSDLVFDSVPAVGEDLTDILINTVWDTTGLLNGSSYQLTATVFDMAGNTDADSVTVEMRPLSCFNGVMDGLETGPDCGGDSQSNEYCGACDGTSCSTNDDCSSGQCEDGVCVSLPVINAVTPSNGAPGTWVTLSGTSFGNFSGSVTFTGAAGPVQAVLANCNNSWSNTQIIVVVPEAAEDGPITILTDGDKSETTFDDNGPLLADFDVNSVIHPGLCEINPDSGSVNDAVTLIGENLGTERGVSKIIFDATEAGSYNYWSDTSADVTVPALPDGEYSVTVSTDGVSSNSVSFAVTSTTLESPVLTSLTPSSGGEGQYVTLSGTNFGGSVGTVWFENPLSGERILADTEGFPEACAADYWSDQEVTIIVPAGLGDPGVFDVVIVAKALESNYLPFTLTDDEPTPGLCALEPANALAGESVTLHGDNFGDSAGTVTFAPGLVSQADTWSDSQLSVTVPTGAVTGAVTANHVDGGVSNPVNFEVSSQAGLTLAGDLAAYAWSFSSGQIPDAPQVIFACTETLISGAPNDAFDNDEGVCVNAAVYVSFTLPMNEGTLSNLTLAECVADGDRPCDQTVLVDGTYDVTSLAVRFDPESELNPSSTYLVTVPETVLSLEGAPLESAESWSFTTRADDSQCRIEDVIIAPTAATIRQQNGTQDFSASPVSGCVVLKDPNTHWSWSVDPSYARFDMVSNPTCQAGDSMCALVEGLSEGETPVRATEIVSGLYAEAALSVDFSDPYITNYWPDCIEACVNAEIGASFNTAMSQASLEAAGAVSLYSCANELCTSLQAVSGAQARCTFDASASCTGFEFNDLTLTPFKYYRVIVDGDITSTSGVGLTRANYAGDYSWTFRVRENASLCAVDRIAVTPAQVTVAQVGAQQTFTGEAYGEADSCSVSGQRLSGFAYNWNWTDPIADEDNDNDPTTRVAAWQPGLVDTHLEDTVFGCTASCTPAGSLPHTAVCGDGVIDVGEECEDGNVASADGCSESCLREGQTAPTCGNGLVNREPSGAGEDCDDGNVVDGDGCSANCLAEGSTAIGATCGNGDIAITNIASLAGEECDDGNALRGDGCSNQCVWEGSPTLSEIGGSLCNDGVLETPTEQCEDGNTQAGDGCSESCLWEGASINYDSTCGLGGIEYGEACDDGNAEDGDGCSSECLLEGSSTWYLEPSFCGDGLAGVGETAACELGVTGDGNFDPIQVAYVPDEAVLEVSPLTQTATATIEVVEVESGLTTSASLSLMCVAESDQECADPIAYGVGTNNCCLLRPEVTLFPNGNNVCRNAGIYALFTDDMELDSFAYEAVVNGAAVTRYRMYARLDLGSTSDGVCPADHTSLAIEPRNLVFRTWNKLVRLLTGSSAKAAPGDCVAPIEAFEQIALGDGTYRVDMHLGALLVANGSYELVVEGDDAVDNNETEGVITELGVGMNSSRSLGFTVGSEICALDAVTVTDTHSDSAYVFSQGGEQHVFVATAESWAGGIPQVIAPISGVYAWDWTNWSSESDGEIVEVAQLDGSPDTASVIAAGKNGDDAVLVTATITDNVTNLPSDQAITGTAQTLAFLCENPWPNDFSQLPWSDTANGDQGAEVGDYWTNFSTMYCRDQGEEGTLEDLPSVVVVRPPVTASANVIKEYLFEVGGSSDAIGVRVVSNQDYLSPSSWYTTQGFTGSPSAAEVDAHQAVRDGRTTYVVAPNQTDDGSLYANVYAISYNEGANDDTIEIYNQMVENLKFAVNVDDVTMCGDEVANCASGREYLQRDLRRLTDMTDLRSTVIDYKSINGVVPSLPSGTFVRSLTSSIWESWNSILGGALQATLAADPINDYLACAEAGYEAYDAETCVNELTGTYVCPLASQAYHYKAVGDNEAYVYADLEYTGGTWVNPIENSSLDGVTLSVGNSSAVASGFTPTAFCDGTSIYGASTSCGDGVVGGDEICELGQLGGTTSECQTLDGLSGTRAQVCDAVCTGYTDNLDGACVVATCGDGVVDLLEECDDGSLNGVYGFCGNDCTYATAFYCGDGQLAGGEVCDCGVSALMSLADSRAYGAGAGSCTNVNGVYANSPNATCAWDCSGPAAYCGDGTVDALEACDGSDDTWAGKLCGSLSDEDMFNQPCVTDSDCGGAGVCGGNGLNNRSACPLGTTRVKACNDNPGDSCTYAVDDWFTIACTEIGSCGDGVVDPGEACDDGNLDGTDACTDVCTFNVCGDGYVYVDEEQCDEGLDNGSGCEAAYGSTCTACSLACRYAVSSGEFCGDGEINGEEYCDANDVLPLWYQAATGDTNGVCTVLDQVSDGYVCTSVGACNGGGAANNGTVCLSSSECGGGDCVFPVCHEACNSTCPMSYASVSLQLVTNQPGAQASEVAEFYSYSDSLTSQLPNAATITVPACHVATNLTASVTLDPDTLPTTYVLFVTDLSYTMKNAVGTNNDPEPGEPSRLDVAKEAMAAAAEELFDKLGDKVQIGSIGYRGLVRGECFYDPTQSCIIPDIDAQAEYGCTLGTTCDAMCDVAAGDYCNANSSIPDGTFFGPTPFAFVGPESEVELIDYTNALTFDPLHSGNDGHGTFTHEALDKAKDMFDDIKNSVAGDNARYITILLSDGEVTDDSNYAAPNDDIFSPDPIDIAEDFDSYIPDTAGYEVYTANLSSTFTWIKNMKYWSSNSYNGLVDSFATLEKTIETNPDVGTPRETSTYNDLDYAYNGNTEAEMLEMYNQIVDSIVEIAVTIVSSNDTDGDGVDEVVETSGLVEEGDNVALPWPENFVCDSLHEQQVPIRITFPGIGQVQVSNVQVNYCAP